MKVFGRQALHGKIAVCLVFYSELKAGHRLLARLALPPVLLIASVMSELHLLPKKLESAELAASCVEGNSAADA